LIAVFAVLIRRCRCADVPGFSTTNGTRLDLWECNGDSNQAWTRS